MTSAGKAQSRYLLKILSLRRLRLAAELGDLVEVGEALGWENAHDVIYAGALDIAVGPRWYSSYEMACNVVTVFIEGDSIHAMPYEGTTEKERNLLLNTEMLTREESETLLHALPPSKLTGRMFIRGTETSVPLTFDRVPPYVSPKSELSDEWQELEDVSVLPVIFSFDPLPDLAVHPGQLVDVYIGER